MKQSGKLILDGVPFELDDCGDTHFYLFESDEHEGTFTIGFEIQFRSGNYQAETVSPAICINEHETGKASAEALTGCTYRVGCIEDAIEREDAFYLFEHEPMERYAFQIVEISEESAQIRIEGVAVTDGYAEPRKTAPFSGEFRLAR